jgi:hypothetical protein
MQRNNPVPESSIIEVMDYITVRDELLDFKKKHATLFGLYDELLAEYRQKLQAADKAVRSRGVSCADWVYYQEQTKYNAEALYTALGRENFLSVGGILETVTTYGLDKKKLEAAHAKKEVSDAVMDQVKTTIKKYHVPETAI